MNGLTRHGLIRACACQTEVGVFGSACEFVHIAVALNDLYSKTFFCRCYEKSHAQDGSVVTTLPPVLELYNSIKDAKTYNQGKWCNKGPSGSCVKLDLTQSVPAQM